MVDWISRSLRDGALAGEHAPALAIKDSILCPNGNQLFHHFLCTIVSNITADTAQSSGVVIVAFNGNARFYRDFLERRGFNATQLDKSVRILDCFTDPLGWKEKISRLNSVEKADSEKLDCVFKDVKDVSKLLTSILDIGKGFAWEGKAHFAVAFDSITDILRHASLPSVANLLSNLRSHDQVSCIFWLIHSDLHETRTLLALEYISSMVASVEPNIQPSDTQKGSENWLEQNSHGGKVLSRLKRRNGRVKLHIEEFNVEQSDIKFSSVSSESSMVNQSLVPKVQFNLQLSEKERDDRAKVILPFEHQGTGETIKIYDGRRSLAEGQTDPYLQGSALSSAKLNSDVSFGKGEIHYLRDSDDEQPDSDEDPDDDLDI